MFIHIQTATINQRVNVAHIIGVTQDAQGVMIILTGGHNIPIINAEAGPVLDLLEALDVGNMVNSAPALPLENLSASAVLG